MPFEREPLAEKAEVVGLLSSKAPPARAKTGAVCLLENQQVARTCPSGPLWPTVLSAGIPHLAKESQILSEI